MRSRIALKRRIRGLAALLMLAVMIGLTPTAFADDDDDDDDRDGAPTALIDFARGTGTAEFEGGLVPSTFDFDVTSGPMGERVAGSATLTSAFGVLFFGPATCLRVVGNLAVFEVDNQNPANASQDVVVFVGDFGVAGVPGVDAFNFDVISMADSDCPDVRERERSVVAGDIVVGDNQSVRRGGDDDDDEGGRLRLRRGGDD
jgi:hypothetical protein